MHYLTHPYHRPTKARVLPPELAPVRPTTEYKRTPAAKLRAITRRQLRQIKESRYA